MIRHFINCIIFFLPPTRLFNLKRKLLIFSGIEISRNACFCGGGWIFGRGRLLIGGNTWISPGSVFYTHTDANIIIGENCDIGPFVKFITGSHIIGGRDRRAGKGFASAISIGDGTWIGANSLILGGVSIGSGCVIAAGSVIISDVKDNTLVAGIPGVFKRNLDE